MHMSLHGKKPIKSHKTPIEPISPNKLPNSICNTDLLVMEEVLDDFKKIPGVSYEQRDQWGIKLLCSNKKYIMFILGFILIIGNVYLVYHTSIVDTSNMGLSSIQVSGIALGAVELLIYMICFPFALKMKRRLTTVICASVIFLGGLTIFIIDLVTDKSNSCKAIIGWISIIVCKGGAAVMYTYINNYMAEVFPTQVRGAGAGIVTAVARFFGASAALIKTCVVNTEFELIVPCSIVSLIVIPIALFMPETINKQID